ncbi:hypothetical protein J4407_01775 [Candidatus Pacearchaeota archaeon]|nr:hypothetical protein [Candidatus Pacearchaeota archaeon]
MLREDIDNFLGAVNYYVTYTRGSEDYQNNLQNGARFRNACDILRSMKLSGTNVADILLDNSTRKLLEKIFNLGEH